MRILVDQGGYSEKNMGDTAMLQVTLARLRRRWPDASIRVLTNAPERLRGTFPTIAPLPADGQTVWSYDLPAPLYGRLPSAIASRLARADWALRHRLPSARWLVLLLAARLARPVEAEHLAAYRRVVRSTDLVVASGGGYITDRFPHRANGTLALMDLACVYGKPTAMFGQGFGPLDDPFLRAKAQAVLPGIDYIALREQREGKPLLERLGVAPSRMTTTGDDAIELAYGARRTALGEGIGVNVRVASYSGVDAPLLEELRLVLHSTARAHGAPLIPVPISHHEDASDPTAIRRVLAAYDDSSNGGEDLDRPLKVIEQVSRCRVVVTGSYHAAVFALAQGVPAVCLAKSQYYVDKFWGLADQFGAGCAVVLLSDEQLRTRLTESIEAAWKEAEQVRPQLLEAAKKQVNSSRSAYECFFDMFAERFA